MEYYKEFFYGFAILILYVLFGIASQHFFMFFSIGLIQAVMITYVLCKLK